MTTQSRDRPLVLPVRTLLSMLSIALSDNIIESKWETYLPKVCLAYNTNIEPTTGHTFFLMFGWEAQVPADITYGSPVQEEKVNQYAGKVHEELQSAYNTVQNRMSGRLLWERAVRQKVHGEEYKKDSLVWLHSTVVKRRKSKKLHRPWSGPFRVIKQLSDVTYRVQDFRNRRRKMEVPFDRLKLYLYHFRQSTETTTRNLPEDNDYVQQQPFGHNLELVENDHLPESHQRSDTQQPQASRYPRQTQVLPQLWWNTDTSTRHTSEEKGSSVTQNCQCV